MRKNKKKALMFGLYTRKLVFFSLVLVFTFSVLEASKSIKSYKADDYSSFRGSSAGNISQKIEMAKNGDIVVDGKISKNKIDLLKDYDELRLLVLEKPGKYINSLEVTLSLPDAIASQIEAEVITQHGVGSSQYRISGDNVITYEASNIAATGEVTIVTKIPKGVIEPPFIRTVVKFINDIKHSFWLLTAIVIPGLTLFCLLAILVFQYKRQRIDIPEKEIDAPPMAIPPAVVGALFKQKVGAREIAASLIDLAKRGDIYIVDRERGFVFGKGKFDQRLLGFEKILLSKIFSSAISSDRKDIEQRINQHLYSKKMSLLTVGIYLLATRLGYFKANPFKMHFKYRMFGVLLFLASFAGFVLSLYIFKDPPYAVFFWIGAMIASLIISFTANNMPIRTPIGQEVLSNWLAFKKYLSNPMPIQYDEANPELFQKYLPYAVVLECEAAWAKRFSEHNFIIPDWFVTDKGGLGLDDFCLTLYPIVSYVGKSFAAIREPGFE